MSGDRHDLGRLLYQDAQVRIVERDEPSAVLVIGEIDITNSSALARALNSCRRDGQPLTVDTGALTFVDMSGLRVLALPGVPAEHRWIRLTNLTPFQKRLLELVGWADKLQQPILERRDTTGRAAVPSPVGPDGSPRKGRLCRRSDSSS